MGFSEKYPSIAYSRHRDLDSRINNFDSLVLLGGMRCSEDVACERAADVEVPSQCMSYMHFVQSQPTMTCSPRFVSYYSNPRAGYER